MNVANALGRTLAVGFALGACKPDAALSSGDSGAAAASSAAMTAGPAASSILAAASASSAAAGACEPPNVMLRTHEFGNPRRCVRPCTNGRDAVRCPERFSCAGDGTNDTGEKLHWCMANEQPPPAVQCKPPELMAYKAAAHEAFCGKPCKTDTECSGGKKCTTARRNWEATLGMQAALANEISVCQ